MSKLTLADGTHVGFVAVKRVLLSFVLNCADDRSREILDPTFVSSAIPNSVSSAVAMSPALMLQPRAGMSKPRIADVRGWQHRTVDDIPAGHAALVTLPGSGAVTLRAGAGATWQCIEGHTPNDALFDAAEQ